MTTDLTHAIHDLIEATPDATAEELAGAVIASATTRKELAALVFPAIRNHAWIARRSITRRMEAAAFSHSSHDIQRRNAEGCDPLAGRQALLHESFSCSDGRIVTWAEATVDDHMLRIGYLTAKQVGLQTTIDRHQEAISLIEAAGASCLADLDVWAAA